MKKATPKNSKFVDAPIAVASDGTVIVNITHLDDTADVTEAVQQLLAEGHQVFVGVVVPAALRRALLRDVNDGLADAVGRLGPRLRRRRAR